LYLHRKQPLIIILAPHEPMVVQVVTEPYYGTLWFKAGPAQFGYNLKSNPPVSIIHYLLCKQDIRKSTTLRTPRTNEFSIKVVLVFNATFNNISVISWLLDWCLTPVLAVFQLFCGITL
jgi:hypothetical protein